MSLNRRQWRLSRCENETLSAITGRFKLKPRSRLSIPVLWPRRSQLTTKLHEGLVRIPDTVPPLEALLAELAVLADGKNDDQVGAIGNVAANREYVVREARRHAMCLGRLSLGRLPSPAKPAPEIARPRTL
jgi:hypothetical protein